MKQYYIIKDNKKNIIRNPDRSIMMFEYPKQAEKKIEKLGNSPYLQINKWKQKSQDHTIKPQKTTGLFIVVNNQTGEEYKVDIKTPFCNKCKAYKYTKKNKDGKKKPCKHIRMCRGVKNKQGETNGTNETNKRIK